MNINDQYTNRLTDRFLTSSDYLSLQNITLGYTLPKSLTRKMQIDGVRVFFVADNVALLTARKGLDPRQGYVAADNVYSLIFKLNIYRYGKVNFYNRVNDEVV